MTDYAETSYNSWTGRKATSLSRPTLDCGCPNSGEVSYHLWCDRLACPAHADDPHDCELFKGKSGSGKEAIPVEAVADVPVHAPLTLTPDDYQALYSGVTWQDIVDTYQRIRDNPGYRSFVLPARAQVTMMTDAEAARFDQLQHLSIECGAMTVRLSCSGCDGLALDGFPCIHNCHEPAVCSCPEVDISAFGDQPRAQVSKGYDPGCRVCPDPYAPPVDAASEPDPDDPLDVDDIAGSLAPWWRRMFSRGANR